MDKNETISIDLTEDDIEAQESHVQRMNYNVITNLNMEENASQENDQQYFAPFQSNIALSKHRDSLSENQIESSLLSDSSELSAVNFIENLQKENPQIETVFIESDEDDGTKQVKPTIKIHDMIIINSPQSNIGDTDKSSLLDIGTSTNRKAIISDNSSKQALNGTPSPLVRNDDLPFTVRAISPSRYNQSFVKHSSTFALQDATDKSSSRKYLVIPKEIAPLLARSKGPISLNVPGIGPLLIEKLSDILNPQPVPAPISVKNSFQKSIHEREPLKNPPIEPIYDPLNDSKYCWRYQRRRKRDLDGFSISDRLGFYKAEQKRTKMCATKYNEIVKRLQLSLNIKKRALMAIKNTRINMENIKLVEIESIKEGKKRDSLPNKNKNVKLKMSRSLAEREKLLHSPKKDIGSPIELSSSESDSTGMNNDLLVTKKVVFINGTEQRRGRKRKRRQWLFSNQHRKKQQKRDHDDQDPLQNKVLQQAVSHDSSEYSLKSSKKSNVLQSKGNKKGYSRKGAKATKTITSIKKNVGKTESFIKTQNIPSISMCDDEDTQNIKCKSGRKGKKHQYGDPEEEALPVRHPNRGLPKEKSSKPSGIESDKQLSNSKVHKIIPCCVEISPSNLVEKALEKYNNHTSSCTKNLMNICKIINSLKQFQYEIQPMKPILVMNEVHCAKMDFKELFCKYNLIFPMSENTSFSDLKIKNMLFVNSAKEGYIKFVKPQILCKYLAGFREI